MAAELTDFDARKVAAARPHAGSERMATNDDALVALVDEAMLDAGRPVPRRRGEPGVGCRAGAVRLAGARRGEADAWHFDAVALRRVRWMVRLERDFEAVPELAALVVDLQAEIERLRARLDRAGLG